MSAPTGDGLRSGKQKNEKLIIKRGTFATKLTNLIGNSIRFVEWEGYLFALCNIATALVTWLFIRLFPRDLSFTAETPTSRQAVHSRRMDAVMSRLR